MRRVWVLCAAIVIAALAIDGAAVLALPRPAEALDLMRIPTAAVAHVKTGRLDARRARWPHAPSRPIALSFPSRYIELGATRHRDPVLQTNTPSTRAPSPTLSFDGISDTGFLPPDPVGDVGPEHYVQAVNGGFAVFDKSGMVRFGPSAFATLWAPIGAPCTTLGKGDPIVQYDSLAGRWMLSEFAFALDSSGNPMGPFFQCIAVSATGDPLGSYNLYSFRIAEDEFPDYPKFGVWPDGYYMTAHFFDATSGAYTGQGVYAFDRVKMLAGQTASAPLAFFNQNLIGALPADVDGTRPPPSGAPNYLVAVEDDGVGFPSDRLEVFRFRADFANPTNSSVTSGGFAAVASFDQNMCDGSLDCIPQPGTAQRLDAIGEGVLMYRLAYRNFGTHESIVLNHVVDVDGRDRAAIRWYELRSPGATPVVRQQGTFAPDTDHRWMGSIAMDASGNIALGYNVVGPTTFPSIRYTGRLAGDPPGILQAETTLMPGGGSQTGANRWGDYSSMNVDPTDDCTFWYTQEYYSATSEAAWRTRIGSFRFPGCSPDAPPPPGPEPDPDPEPDRTDTTPPAITGVGDRPDPFTPDGDGRKDKAKILFTIDDQSDVTVTIRKGDGTLVRRLAEGTLAAGPWLVRWDGRRSSGRLARSGIYVYVITATDAAGNSSSAEGTVGLRR